MGKPAATGGAKVERFNETVLVVPAQCNPRRFNPPTIESETIKNMILREKGEGKVGGAVREGLAMAQQHMQEKAAGIKHRGTEHLNSRPIAGDAKGVFHIAKVRNLQGAGNFLNHSHVTGECGALGE
mmetsp:Transcript_20257/g.33974  ORF Transcript_20257/g.33974 Transcript_20257/m.33974 type:complete len:127 (-) Transcript_20257:328-708(-)|eukprot:CAMPEP_0198198132 /NCGR_PEP_ID=MMETSP1445-20131203/1618_1 /TAXON_ID=36898 /ORGANISM="Pyramimonas sp., Strain CCMP2087" /LENGTH=126 /DNA_ID=CAMNT_0043867597 /DNA_START=104 /DNA_END=484 /DNA_ORIENTATION=-